MTIFFFPGPLSGAKPLFPFQLLLDFSFHFLDSQLVGV